MNVSVWYQFMTDITGKELASELAKKRPNDDVSAHPTWKGKKYDVLIGWGCKEPDDYAVGNTDTANCKLVINRLVNIRLAANKLKALGKMKEAGVRVPTFVPSSQIKTALAGKTMAYPIIGRPESHQAGQGFWECKMLLDVDAAIRAGAKYFTQFIPNTDEYRIHVFGGEVLAVTKKTQQENPARAFKTIRTEQFERHAKKDGITLDKKTLDFALDEFLKRDIQLPKHSERHNDRGWKFSLVATNTAPVALRDQAILAVTSLGLDFGAVDCIMGENSLPYVIEVNTAPSLRETMLEKYVAAFDKFIKAKLGGATATATRTQETRQDATTGAGTAKLTPARRAALKEAFDVSDEGIDALVKVFGSLKGA